MFNVKRGEIYLYDFGKEIGSIQGGKRPVVILQSDDFNMYFPTVVVAAITSVIKKTNLSSHVVLKEKYGLMYPSMILLEQMITIKKSALEKYIGAIDDRNILELIDKGIRKTLDIYYPYKNLRKGNNFDSSSVMRGELYLYDFGYEKGLALNGVRPVVVLQNDAINRKSPTTVVFSVSNAKRTYLPSQIFIKQNYGLEMFSVINLNQIAVVNQFSLQKKIGEINSKKIQGEIYRGLKMVFGLYNKPKLDDKGDWMCLCQKCLKSIMWGDDAIVKRADPFQKYKDRCIKCDGFGFDYIISRRNGGVHNG